MKETTLIVDIEGGWTIHSYDRDEDLFYTEAVSIPCNEKIDAVYDTHSYEEDGICEKFDWDEYI